MAHSPTGYRPQDVEARAILEKAKSDELPHIGNYRLRDRTTEQVISLPDILVENADGDPGEELAIYADLSTGYAVIDLDGTGGGES